MVSLLQFGLVKVHSALAFLLDMGGFTYVTTLERCVMVSIRVIWHLLSVRS